MTVTRPSGVNVGVFNPGEAVYLKGREDLDGSLRVVPDITDGTKFQFEVRAGGAWNTTGGVFSQSSVLFGRDLVASAAGEWLQTLSVNTGDKALLPHVNFTEAGSSAPHAAATGQKIEDFPIQPDDSSEVTGLDLQQVAINPSDLLASRFVYKTGSIGSTEAVTLTFRRGTDTSAPIFWQRRLALDLMATADTEFEILLGDIDNEVDGFLEGITGESIHTQFLSTADISLASNSSGDFYVVADFTPLAIEELLRDNLILTTNGELVYDTDFNLITTVAFA